MIIIQKNGMTLRVTKGAYDNFYRGLGYEPVGGVQSGEKGEGEVNLPPVPENPACDDSTLKRVSDNENAAPENPADDPEAPAEDAPDEDEVKLSETPLSEMTLSQLYEYAEELGLDFEGTPKAKEMRKLIREHLS